MYLPLDIKSRVTKIYSSIQKMYLSMLNRFMHLNTAGNVVRGNRTVMQSESSRELPDMSHEIRETVNSQVSFHVLYFFTVLQFRIYKNENTVPKSTYFLYPKRMNRAHISQ